MRSNFPGSGGVAKADPYHQENQNKTDEEPALFRALHAANVALQKHETTEFPKLQQNLVTKEERAQYFITKRELKKASHQAFLEAFPRLKEKDVHYTERSKADQRRLLEDEYIKTQHEIDINELIYHNHGCDSWEDVFRDKIPQLKERCYGIRVALETMYVHDE